jgi:ethanolamine utilization protein EutN
MLLVEFADISGTAKGGSPIVALDTVDAGVGDLVLIVRGSSARQAANMSTTPVDAAVIGIIDNIQLSGETTFTTSK